VQLRPYAEDDIWLTSELETDPDVMGELGGPQPREEIPKTHARRLRTVAGGDWWLVIETEPGVAVGTIGVWPTAQDGVDIHEVGWMVLPRFQRRGIASAALAELIERSRSERRITSLHAFPGATNVASNALCRKAGFTWLDEREVLLLLSARGGAARSWRRCNRSSRGRRRRAASPPSR
jgi:RimJ/RimL family protein N-acetyltransferase